MKNMKNRKQLLALLLLITFIITTQTVWADLRSDFADPPLSLKSRPLWFWNSAISTTGINDQMQNSLNSGYYGFGILPFSGMSPGYLSTDYFSRYGDAIAKAAAQGQKLCLYDEYEFPSGSAGGQLKSQYPNDAAKRLDLTAENVTGPTTYVKTIPAGGTLMGVAAMENNTKERRDITGYVSGGVLNWSVPSGSWKVMIFRCVLDGWDRVDFLNSSSVSKFIQLTHQRYYDRFPSSFGTTIDSTFYDEPTMWTVQGGRMWTESFNSQFQTKYGYSPVPYYPALWYDIGSDTMAARNALFGFRAELFATGFAKTINDWCAAHGIQLTGHVGEEEIINPTGLCGDLMKTFKYQDIPGVDEVIFYGRTSRSYKVVSSAAFNYDRSLVMTECYGAMGEGMGIPMFYKEAMDQYAKGINLMMPHAIWYNNGSVTYPPELSYRNPTYGPELPNFNKYIGRLNRMLQAGRHVADIGVLYPIATMHAGYYFDAGYDPYKGGITPLEEGDYMDIGEMLALKVRRDFTFVHPESLDEKCTVSGAAINLNNTTNYEQYKVFLMPGSKAIKWSVLQKIKQFYDNGGKVIATRQLPYKSADFGHDSEVSNTILAMFGLNPATSAGPLFNASSQYEVAWDGPMIGFEPWKAGDADPVTRWNAQGDTTGNQWLEINFGAAKTFNKTIIHEDYNRITSYNIQYWNGSSWVNCVSGTTVGAAKTDNFSAVTASKIRLYINTASACVSINEFEVFNNSTNLVFPSYVTNTNANGGKAYFIPNASAGILQTVIDNAQAVYDVEFESNPAVTGGNLSYIHKVKDGTDVYFFGNSSSNNVDTYVRLKGCFIPENWDPHTGNISAPEYSIVSEAGQNITRVRLVLPSVKSVFIRNSGPAPTPNPNATPTPTPAPTPTATPQTVVVDQDDSGASFTLYHDIYSNVQRYQIFTPSTVNLPRVDVYTYKYGSPAAALTLRIVALDGSDNPTGAALYSIDIPASSVPTSLSAVSIYPNLTTLTPGAKYAILWKSPGCPDLNNDYGFGYTDTNPYPNGYEKYTANGGSTWNPESSRDLKFTTYKYGGVTPTPTPLLTDDFSGDLSKWVDTANATISSGQLTVTNNEIMRSVSGAGWTNYTFEVDVKITANVAGLAFRSVDDNNYYMWQLNADTDKLRPHKKVGGSWTVIKEVSTTIALNTTYHVKIEANGSTIKTYIGGNLVDTTTDTAFSAGKVGFRQAGTETAVFDNVIVRGL